MGGCIIKSLAMFNSTLPISSFSRLSRKCFFYQLFQNIWCLFLVKPDLLKMISLSLLDLILILSGPALPQPFGMYRVGSSTPASLNPFILKIQLSHLPQTSPSEDGSPKLTGCNQPVPFFPFTKISKHIANLFSYRRPPSPN